MDPVDTRVITRRSLLAGAAAALAAGPLALARENSLIPPSPAIRTLNGRLRLADGRCLGYADLGSPTGPLVLFFHGTPGSRLEATLIAEEALAANVRLVSIDRPGLGLSTQLGGRRILDWPADAQALADGLGYAGTAFGILAISGGTPYALACACRIPHRLTHVAIVSGHTPMNAPGAGRGSQDNFIQFIGRRPRLARIAINVLIRRLHKKPSAVLSRIASAGAASDRRLLLNDSRNRNGLHANLLAATRQGSGAVITAVNLLGGNWGFRLDQIPPLPVSIWQGGCDPIAPPSMGRYFHRHLAGSEYYLDPAAGHVTMLKWHAREILAKYQLVG